LAAFCGQLGVGWRFLEARDPRSRGVVERPQGYAEASFEPGRSFAAELDFREQLDRWFDERANAGFDRRLRCRPLDRRAEELTVVRPLPDRVPDVDRRWVIRIAPDPYVRVDTCDYSLDPRLVGRRVELRVSQRELLAVALDTGELARRHARSFARDRTITALEHAHALRELRGASPEPEVEQRPLARYDALIPARPTHDEDRGARLPLPDAEGAGRRAGAAQARTWRSRSGSVPASPASGSPSPPQPNRSPASQAGNARAASTRSCASCSGHRR
jgi:Mu transposase, C-terminal domain